MEEEWDGRGERGGGVHVSIVSNLSSQVLDTLMFAQTNLSANTKIKTTTTK